MLMSCGGDASGNAPVVLVEHRLWIELRVDHGLIVRPTIRNHKR